MRLSALFNTTVEIIVQLSWDLNLQPFSSKPSIYQSYHNHQYQWYNNNVIKFDNIFVIIEEELSNPKMVSAFSSYISICKSGSFISNDLLQTTCPFEDILDIPRPYRLKFHKKQPAGLHSGELLTAEADDSIWRSYLSEDNTNLLAIAPSDRTAKPKTSSVHWRNQQ